MDPCRSVDPFVPSLGHRGCVIPKDVQGKGWTGLVAGNTPSPVAAPPAPASVSVLTQDVPNSPGVTAGTVSGQPGGALDRAYPGARIPAREGLAILGAFAVIVMLNSVAVRPMARAASQLGGPWWLHLQLVVGGVVVQYGLMALLCLAACRRWGCGSPGPDLGLRREPGDIADGVTGWLAGLALMTVLAMGLRGIGIPAISNNPLTNSGGGLRLGLPQWALIALVGVIMVVVAPVLEELLFRGVLLRSLSATWPLPLALGTQAVLFGAFHLDPERGWANVGLVVVLSGIGLVLGWLVHRQQGRLAPGIVAHSLQNAVAFAVGINVLV